MIITDGGASRIIVPAGFEVRIVKTDRGGEVSYHVEKRRMFLDWWLWWSKANYGGYYRTHESLVGAKEEANELIAAEQRRVRRKTVKKDIIKHP